MPVPLPIAGTLHHVEVNVADLARSVAFWGRLLEGLGYAPFQAWPQGRSWRLGATYLVLVQTAAGHRDRAYDRRATGLNHLAFHVPTPADVDRWTAALERDGVLILYRDRHPHAGGPDAYAVFFEDPDRIKVEIVASGALDRPAIDLLAIYVVAHNDGVRSGDFGPMLVLFRPDAILAFHGIPVGPFAGRDAIARAFRERPPDDTLALVDATPESMTRARAGYAWTANPGRVAGHVVLEAFAGVIVRLDVSVVEKWD